MVDRKGFFHTALREAFITNMVDGIREIALELEDDFYKQEKLKWTQRRLGRTIDLIEKHGSMGNFICDIRDKFEHFDDNFEEAITDYLIRRELNPEEAYKIEFYIPKEYLVFKNDSIQNDHKKWGI